MGAAGRKNILIKDYKDALTIALGLHTGAAQILGISRQAVDYKVKTSPTLKTHVESLCERNLDIAESKLYKEINKGNLTAIIFYLKCKGKKRGYVEREAESIEDNSTVVFVTPEMSTEESWSKLPKK